MFFVYMLRCSDNSIYTGYTTDVKRRFTEHCTKSKQGAKYTHSRTAVSVDAVWETDSKSSALKLEALIKKMRKTEKENIIKSPELISAKYKEKLGENVYKSIKYED